MHRFFVNKENISNDRVIINGGDVKHIKNVLRLNIGDNITVCDGDNHEYIVKIKAIHTNEIEGVVIEELISNKESSLEIILYQGLPKSAKMDLIIQKATELGVKKIIPLITNRTVVKINDKKKQAKKIQRWQRIAEESAKQCKRGVIPKIDDIKSFDSILKTLSKEKNILVPYEKENKVGMKEILKNVTDNRIHIIIGPEGGFEEEEINQLEEINSKIVSLGPRILRTETAGFTVIAITMYELGDLGVI